MTLLRPTGPRALPALLGLAALLAAPAARATTFTVTDTADNAADTQSLRYAVNHAANGDTIQITATGTIKLDPPSGPMGTLGGPLAVTTGVTLAGPGAGSLTVDAQGKCSVLEVSGGTAGQPVQISDLTIQGGNADGNPSAFSAVGGGAIANSGTLTMTACTIQFSSAQFGGGLSNTGTAMLAGCLLQGSGDGGGVSGEGGNVFNSLGATLTLTGCTLNASTVGFAGGGLYNDGAATVTGCYFGGNQTTESAGIGGGIRSQGGSLMVTNSVFDGNEAGAGLGSSPVTGQGGAIYVDGGTATVTNSTTTNNRAAQGAGFYYDSGTVQLTNDVFFGDSAGASEIAATTSSQNVPASHCDIQQASGTYPGTSNINQNPQFVSLSSPLPMGPPLPFLATTSPCAGTGATQAQAPAGVFVPSSDIVGSPRPTPPSIGAGECLALSATAQVSITASGFVYNHVTRLFASTFTVTNTGGVALSGPLTLALDGLASKVTVVSATGTTLQSPAGSPLVGVTSGSLPPSGTVQVVVRFRDPSLVPIHITPRLFAGPGVR